MNTMEVALELVKLLKCAAPPVYSREAEAGEVMKAFTVIHQGLLDLEEVAGKRKLQY